MTNLNAAAIDAAVIALKVHGGFDETETDDDPIWREEAETAVSAYLAALPKPDTMGFSLELQRFMVKALEHEDAAQFRDWESFEFLGDELAAARQALIDLYTEAAR